MNMNITVIHISILCWYLTKLKNKQVISSPQDSSPSCIVLIWGILKPKSQIHSYLVKIGFKFVKSYSNRVSLPQLNIFIQFIILLWDQFQMGFNNISRQPFKIGQGNLVFCSCESHLGVLVLPGGSIVWTYLECFWFTIGNFQLDLSLNLK